MAGLILFHRAQGLTDGVRAFAGGLRATGHVIHVPDLYERRTSPRLEGMACAAEVGSARSSSAAGPRPRSCLFLSRPPTA